MSKIQAALGGDQPLLLLPWVGLEPAQEPSSSEEGAECRGAPLETSSYVSFNSDNDDKAQEPSAKAGRGCVQGARKRAGEQLRGAEGLQRLGRRGRLLVPRRWAGSSADPGKGSPCLFSPQPATEPLPVTVANITPIPGTGPLVDLAPASPPWQTSGGLACGEQQEPVMGLDCPSTPGPRLPATTVTGRSPQAGKSSWSLGVRRGEIPF